MQLTNGSEYGADFVISAIGVVPNTNWLEGVIPLAEGDGGILVDRQATLLPHRLSPTHLWHETSLASCRYQK